MSGDDFTATDANTGALWFRVDGKVMTMRQRKTLLDNRNQPAAVLTHKVMSLHKTVRVYSPADPNTPLFVAQKKTTLKYRKATAHLVVTNLMDGSTANVSLKGDARGKAGIIALGREGHDKAHVIAKMYKPTTAKQMFLDQHTYLVDVAPGVDAGFITALCVIWDEFSRDEDSNNSAASYAF